MLAAEFKDVAMQMMRYITIFLGHLREAIVTAPWYQLMKRMIG
jgi:hypothetical protein